MKRPVLQKASIRIATRGSALALAQAGSVLAECCKHFPNEQFELCVIKTTGDRQQHAVLQRPAPHLPKGLFTKELEMALQNDEADLAVHSLKDLPTSLPSDLRLGAVLPRADVSDVLILRADVLRGTDAPNLSDLPQGSVVATSSTRRAAQLRVQRPDLRWIDLRGNVPTRLHKLAQRKGFDATLLAAAGLARLGIAIAPSGLLSAPPELAPGGWGADLRACILPVDLMLPAPGQGAIGIECRRRDHRVIQICRHLNDGMTRICVEAERAFLASFGGGCQSPVAALARVKGDRLELEAVAFEGGKVWRDRSVGLVTSPKALGRALGRAARQALFS